jgi:ring-1,2-phenylacetyl-CoA epoxidase subunit PaaD
VTPPRPVSLDTPLHNDAIPKSVECPFCGESETEQFSAFGSALSVSQYYCRRCRTVFEWMKRREPPAGDGPGS